MTTTTPTCPRCARPTSTGTCTTCTRTCQAQQHDLHAWYPHLIHPPTRPSTSTSTRPTQPRDPTWAGTAIRWDIEHLSPDHTRPDVQDHTETIWHAAQTALNPPPPPTPTDGALPTHIDAATAARAAGTTPAAIWQRARRAGITAGPHGYPVHDLLAHNLIAR